MSTKPKAAFFDRDGVINRDVGYLYRIEDLRFLKGAREALAYLAGLGYKIIIVTNQSGIARGYYTVADMEKLHAYMVREIEAAGGRVDRIYYCPHHKEGKVREYAIDCQCRKPKPGMLLRALEEFGLDASKSFLIGDSVRDIEAAEDAGIKGFLFKGGSLLDFTRKVLKEMGAL